MSTENLTKFQARVAIDPALRERVLSVHQAGNRQVAEQLAALSAGTDSPFTADEFLAAASSQTAELSDDQLEAVAGGVWDPNAGNICASIFTLGLACAVVALASASKTGHHSGDDTCQIKHPDSSRPDLRPG